MRCWLDEHLAELGDGPLTCTLLSGGSSNAVFRISRGGESVVLRRPPKVPRPDSNRIIEREARMLKALTGSDVPHPHFHAYCADDTVIGAPFYLMAMVDGWLGYDENRFDPAPFNVPQHRRQKAFALVEGIARLAKVDYRAVGLKDFGRPEGFLERQVDRWASLLASYRESENYPGREIPGLKYAADWLRANTPAMSPAGIIHGDYSFANALFQHQPPVRLAAMIDWELTTVGDPLLDLGWVLYAFRGRDESTPPAGYFDPDGYPYREELAEYYAERTGRDIGNLTYYMVLAQYKLACILERHYARMLNGRQTRHLGEVMGKLVLRLGAKAGEMAKAAG
ncbi:Putative aminoglycoside phosphotransferase [Aromatoleum petrolei]|nr:Putative aminoglycoside phosphotransferase [Aromatoleum petrolei]